MMKLTYAKLTHTIDCTAHIDDILDCPLLPGETNDRDDRQLLLNVYKSIPKGIQSVGFTVQILSKNTVKRQVLRLRDNASALVHESRIECDLSKSNMLAKQLSILLQFAVSEVYWSRVINYSHGAPVNRVHTDHYL